MRKISHEDQPIFVLGVPRSGTSLTAGIFYHCGAWLGRTVPSMENNPKGFFEHVMLREQINKGILRALKCDPLGVTNLPSLGGLSLIRNIKKDVLTLIRAGGYPGDRPWVFKDAKLTLLWPIWKHAFPHSRWIVVRRRHEEIIHSCLNTNFMMQHSRKIEFWQKWIGAYMLRLDLLKASGAWYREVWPERWIQGDLDEIKYLIKELDLRWHEEKVIQFITPKYWHTTKE